MEKKDLIKKLLQNAIKEHASDIFFLPQKNAYQVSLRLATGLKKAKTFSLSGGQEIINYFKYTAQMDISEHRRPQVGAMTFVYQQMEYYLRLSSIGDFNDRETLVVRLIYQISSSNYFFDDQLTELKKLALKRGLILTSGPTGSGKTTTMYELAKELGQDKIVMTIEDPVEVHEATFLQTQVNNEAGIDYQTLLKAALRHRPDILIIGEIRDAGTARVAIDAALSGHLVLATVHAKSTYQTIGRLKGLGITTNELFNCLTAVSYQRLLPNRDSLACLLDIAHGQNLFQKDQNAEFADWHHNLKLLRERGEISEECYRQYQEG